MSTISLPPQNDTGGQSYNQFVFDTTQYLPQVKSERRQPSVGKVYLVSLKSKAAQKYYSDSQQIHTEMQEEIDFQKLQTDLNHGKPNKASIDQTQSKDKNRESDECHKKSRDEWTPVEWVNARLSD